MTYTAVTAVYDIGRDRIDNRTMNDYLGFLLQTLKLKVPFVIFLDNSLDWEDKILTFRKTIGPTKIIKTSLEDIPFWKYKKDIQKILQTPQFISTVRYPNDITYKLPEYVLLQYSKFGWVHDAMTHNYFDTARFMWLDAGISRLFTPDFTQADTLYPLYIYTSDCIFEINREHLLPFITFENYIGTCECIVRGGSFYAHVDTFDRLYQNIIQLFETEMIRKNRYDNEQVALTLLHKFNPNLFTTVQSDGNSFNVFLHTFIRV